MEDQLRIVMDHPSNHVPNPIGRLNDIPQPGNHSTTVKSELSFEFMLINSAHNDTQSPGKPYSTHSAKCIHGSEATSEFMEESDDRGSVSSSNVTLGGVTQSIRAKLNFNDNLQWRRFSARRLELIDTLELSGKKASEQQSMIQYVADELRKEYGFPEDALPDFDRLVRAAIQSVRRNRKRNKALYRSESQPSRASSSSPLPHNQPPVVLPSLSEVIPWHSNGKPAVKVNNPNLHSSNSSFLVALERLASFTSRVQRPVVKIHADQGQLIDNHEFLGQKILDLSVGFLLESYVTSRQYTNELDARGQETIRQYVLSPVVVNAMAVSVGLQDMSTFVSALGVCSLQFGCDSVISLLRNVYYELLDIFQLTNLTPERLAGLFPPTNITERYSSTASTITSTFMSERLSKRPVLLRFLDKRLELTYEPKDSGPPTLSEVIDNGRTAFGLSDQRVLLVRDVNRRGRMLGTDEEIAEAFGGAKVDLELTYPT